MVSCASWWSKYEHDAQLSWLSLLTDRAIWKDDKVNSKLMQKRLSIWNHLSVAVENGREATELVEKDFDFDCIMMDLQ